MISGSEPAPCPATFRRILLATDFAPGSKRALRRAAALARQCRAELHLLHVHAFPQGRAIFFISIPAASTEAILSRVRTRVGRRFSDFLRGEDLEGVETHTALRTGAPDREIVRYAEDAGVDLIVLGERPETRAQHLLQHLAFESVGERVRRGAPCSVLTVR